MGQVSAWLLDMENLAFDLLLAFDASHAREEFLRQFPHQEKIFDACLMQWDGDDNSQFGVGA